MKICKHNDGMGRCVISDDCYCVEGPCSHEELVEYEPVKHGRWNPTHDYDSCWCSCCKKKYTGFFASDWNYCPNCGAKMDLEG